MIPKNHEQIVKYAYYTICIVVIKWIKQKRDVFKISIICQCFENASRSSLCQRLRMLSSILNYSTQGLSRDCPRILESAQPLQECSSSVQTFLSQLYLWLQVDLNDFSGVVEQCFLDYSCCWDCAWRHKSYMEEVNMMSFKVFKMLKICLHLVQSKGLP